MGKSRIKVLRYVVKSDFTGTLLYCGKLSDGVADCLKSLGKLVEIHILSDP